MWICPNGVPVCSASGLRAQTIASRELSIAIGRHTSCLHPACTVTGEDSELAWQVCRCGHCQQLAPKWNKLADALAGVVKVAAVNCEEQQGICQQNGWVSRQAQNASLALLAWLAEGNYQGSAVVGTM